MITKDCQRYTYQRVHKKANITPNASISLWPKLLDCVGTMVISV